MSDYEFDEFSRITKPINSMPNKCSSHDELINEISCDILTLPKESEPPKRKKKLIENPNNSRTPTESGKIHENTRLVDNRLTKVTLNN